MGSLGQEQTKFISQFEVWLKDYIAACQAHPYRADILVKSQEYSLLSGGKRFRPFLAYSVFKLFSETTEKIQSVALALEMIHTYSLIHDDLPCMDNDDFRRGKPTNHKVFSEEIALLAADGLLSDVFNLLSRDRHSKAEVKIKLIEYISEKIGSFGMVSGQTKDMQADKNITLLELKLIHQLKTANLIQAAAVCGALVA
ncbi:MAG: polyprenyl synthetase family protein, partial [Pseudobdellovibrio sp.]